MVETNLSKNDVVGKWRLERTLGAGGQATVWRVRYVDDGHSPPGALKVCSSRTEKARSRFSRELELLRDQTHPGIVRVRDAGEYQGLPYFVMELATTTLAHIALAESAGTRLVLESRELLLRLLRQACEALAHLHASGILHRDIKPSNILLMLDPPEPMRAVLADLGIAANEADQGKLTATHEMIGTPAFRAPESFSGRHSARSDVYALGKTIEAVLNRGTPVEIGPGRCLRDQRLTDDLWDALDEVLAQACAFDPALRYEDAAAFVRALPEAVLGLSSEQGREVQGQRPSTISLNVAERVTLSDIVAECPAVEDRIGLDYVRRKTRLNEYQFSISVRRLEDINFLETSIAYAEHGESTSLVQPTRAGIRWAHEHDEEMVAAITEVAPKSSAVDEIPF